jgi:HlyD family secretion protein
MKNPDPPSSLLEAGQAPSPGHPMSRGLPFHRSRPSAAGAAGEVPSAGAPKAEPPSSVPPRRRPWWWLAGAVALLGCGLLALPRLVGGPEIAVRRVVQRDFVESVVASGHVEAPHRVTVGAVMVGKVEAVPVAEGQAVSAGQALVLLDAREWQAAAAQADAAVAQAQARLRQVGELDAEVAAGALREAEVTLRNARLTQQRDASLLAQGFIGPAAMEEADKAVDVALAQWRSAQAGHRAALPTGTNVAIAATALAQARAAAAAAHSRLSNTAIVAPVAGTLIARDVEPGDVVQPGMPLMVLSPDGAAQLVVDIDEKNIHLLALGQPARASADAFPNQVFDARVAYLNPGIDIQRGSVEVKLDVPQAPAFLRQDMTVSVDIQVATRRGAVLAPLEAVRDADGTRPWVLRVEGGHAVRHDVRLGLRSAGWAEVLAGVAAGDQVVPVAASIGEGDRLRAREAAR